MILSKVIHASVPADPAKGLAGSFTAGAHEEFGEYFLGDDDFWAAATHDLTGCHEDGGYVVQTSDAASVVSSISADSLRSLAGEGSPQSSTGDLGTVASSDATAAAVDASSHGSSAASAASSSASTEYRRAAIARWKEKRRRLLSGRAKPKAVVERSRIACSRTRVGGRFVKSAVQFTTMAQCG